MILTDVQFRHEAVNHSAGEYARGEATTNSIESVWAVLKRGVYGVYQRSRPSTWAAISTNFPSA